MNKISRFIQALKMDNEQWLNYLEKDRNYVDGMRVNSEELPLIREIALRMVKPNLRVLSAGCGAGREVRFLVDELGCEVVAVDISKKMIKLSRKMEDRNVEYVYCDITKYVSPKKFDYIVCLFNTINQLNDVEQRKRFIHACEINLKDNGVLIICSTNKFSSWQSWIFSLFPSKRKPSYHPNQIGRWFNGTKFKIEIVKLNDELVIKAVKDVF